MPSEGANEPLGQGTQTLGELAEGVAKIRIQNPESPKVSMEHVDSGLLFEPRIVPSSTVENAGNVDVITDNCGRTEARRNGQLNYDVTIEGDFGIRDEMLTLMDIYDQDSEVIATVDLYSGRLIVQDISITQQVSPTHVVINGREQRVYTYQIQLKQPGSEDSSSA